MARSRSHKVSASMGPLSEESGEAALRLRSRWNYSTASMGPLSEESGETPVLNSAAGRTDRGFNGAALRRERRAGAGSVGATGARSRFNGAALRRERRALRHGLVTTYEEEASMGPFSEESGELAARNDLPREHRRPSLQWGRSPKRAESPPGAGGAETLVTASMGPLSEESGETSPSIRVQEHPTLQWGRSPKRAESLARLDDHPPDFSGFNGAALRRERRAGGRSAGAGTRFERFNGAALRRERRARGIQDAERSACGSFNGAALRRERRVTSSARPRRRPRGFNGAALRRERRAVRLRECRHVAYYRFNGAALRRERRGRSRACRPFACP